MTLALYLIASSMLCKTQQKKVLVSYLNVLIMHSSKANLLQPLTEAQQAAALAAAIRVLPHWRSKALSGSEKYKRWLTEVGLTAEDLALFDRSDAQATANPKVRAALRQMVGQMIMDPNPGKKPAWMSDPRFALICTPKIMVDHF